MLSDVPRGQCTHRARSPAQGEQRALQGGGRAAVHPGGGTIGGATQRSPVPTASEQKRGGTWTNTPGDMRSRCASLHRGGDTAHLCLEQHRQAFLRRECLRNRGCCSLTAMQY